MTLLESGQMYLETILLLSQKKEHVRSIDVSEYMNFSKPSVSRAMGILKKENYIVIDTNGYITLTASGLEIAEKILERHHVLTDMLISLGVTPDVAEADACKMEHVISDETFAAIKEHRARYGGKKA